LLPGVVGACVSDVGTAGETGTDVDAGSSPAQPATSANENTNAINNDIFFIKTLPSPG